MEEGLITKVTQPANTGSRNIANKSMQGKNHKLTLSQRNEGNISGVTDVISFDTKEIILETALGILTINGNELHVSRLNLEKEEVDIEGQVESMVYSESGRHRKAGESIFSRLFK